MGLEIIVRYDILDFFILQKDLLMTIGATVYTPSTLCEYFSTQDALHLEANAALIINNIDEWDEPGVTDRGSRCIQELREATALVGNARMAAFEEKLNEIFRSSLLLLSKGLQSLKTEGNLKFEIDPQRPALQIVSDRRVTFITCQTHICATFKEIFFRIHRCNQPLVVPANHSIFITGPSGAVIQDILRRNDSQAIVALMNEATPPGRKSNVHTTGNLDIFAVNITVGRNQNEPVTAFNFCASQPLTFKLEPLS